MDGLCTPDILVKADVAAALINGRDVVCSRLINTRCAKSWRVAHEASARLGQARNHARAGNDRIAEELLTALYQDHANLRDTNHSVRTPGLADVPYPVVMEPNLVIEYYAQN